jgi:TRAP transporter TAXI family solute receptor
VKRLPALVIALVLALTACTGTSRPTRVTEGHLTIASGGTTGVYYAYAGQLRRILAEEVPGLTTDVVSTAGSGENIDRLSDNRAQLGFSTADSVYDSGAAGKLRAIARVYDEYIHVVVRAGSPARSVRDLKGLRVSTGSPSSSTELVAERVLGAVGLDADRDLTRSGLGITEAPAALRAGRIDAFFWSGGLPTPAIRNLAAAVPIRLLPVGDQASDLRRKYGTYYRRATIPPATYAGVGQTITIGVPNYLLVATAVDDATVYRITQVLFLRRSEIAKEVPSGQRLDSRSAISTMPVRLHPGAERYYREAKP